MTHLGDIAPGEEIHFLFTTVTTTGAPTQLAGSPAAAVYREDNTTESTAGLTLLIDHDSRTGMNYLKILTAADAAFYYDRAMYNVVLTAGTVGGTSVVGYKICSFRVRLSIAEQVWGYSVGAVAGVSDSFASAVAEMWTRVGALLDVAVSTRSSQTSQDTIGANVTNLQSRLPESLIGGRIAAHVERVSDGVVSFASFAQSYWDGLVQYVWGSSVGALAGVSDSFASAMGETWSRVVALLDVAVSTRATAIDTSSLATQASVNSLTDQVTDVQSRLPASLIAGRMSSHVEAVSDGALSFAKFSQGYWDGVQAYVWAAPVSQYAGVSDGFGSLLNDIRNELENVPGEVWDVVLSAHLGAGTTGFALNAAGAAGDPWSTALPGAYGAGTAGNILGNRLDVAVSTRFAAADYSAPPSADTVAGAVWGYSVGAVISVSDSFAQAVGEIWARSQYLDVPVSTRFGGTVGDIADAVWDENVGEHLGSSSNAGYILYYSYLSQVGTQAAVQDASATSGSFDTTLDALSKPDGFYNDTQLTFITGNLSGQSRIITQFYGNGIVQFDEPFSSAPANGDTFAIKTGHVHSEGRIATAVWEYSVSSGYSISDSYGQAVAELWARTPTVAEIVDGVWDEALAGHAAVGSAGEALTDAASAGGASADDIAAAVWGYSVGGFVTVSDSFGEAFDQVRNVVLERIDATISSRLASSGYTAPLDAAGTRAAVGLASANLDTQLDALPTAIENADALLGRNIAGGSNGGRTVTSALRFLRNRWVISAGALTVYQEDDTAVAWTGSVSQDASAQPVVGNDPS